MNAIVLAGGKGSRLQPWHAPKCLLPINGVPILYRLLSHVLRWTDAAAVCVGYRADDVQNAIAHMNSEFVQARVTLSNAGDDAPMGERLLKVRGEIAQRRSIVVYGDELADVDVEALLKAHGHNAMTFTAYEARVPGGAVVDTEDRPRIIEGRTSLVNIGFVVVESECWDLLKPEDGVSDWINRVSMQKRVGVYVHDGKRATVNSLADLAYAEEVWK